MSFVSAEAEAAVPARQRTARRTAASRIPEEKRFSITLLPASVRAAPRGTRGERQREKFPPVCGYGWKAAREPQRAAPVSSSAVKQVTQASSRLSQARFMTPR